MGEKVSINKIVRLKVNDIDKLVKLAKEKYKKIYDRTDILTQQINEYESKKDELMKYAKTKYNVTIADFFTERIVV